MNEKREEGEGGGGGDGGGMVVVVDLIARGETWQEQTNTCTNKLCRDVFV